MDKEFWRWTAIIVTLVALATVIVIDAQKQNRQFAWCHQERIRQFPEKFFTWKGMLELNQAGLYQPKCL